MPAGLLCLSVEAGGMRLPNFLPPPMPLPHHARQVKWGADYLINAHVEDYVFMGSMGNQTEGELRMGRMQRQQRRRVSVPARGCTPNCPCRGCSQLDSQMPWLDQPPLIQAFAAQTLTAACPESCMCLERFASCKRCVSLSPNVDNCVPWTCTAAARLQALLVAPLSSLSSIQTLTTTRPGSCTRSTTSSGWWDTAPRTTPAQRSPAWPPRVRCAHLCSTMCWIPQSNQHTWDLGLPTGMSGSERGATCPLHLPWPLIVPAPGALQRWSPPASCCALRRRLVLPFFHASLPSFCPAALATASELLRSDNPAWADKALKHAKQVGVW